MATAQLHEKGSSAPAPQPLPADLGMEERAATLEDRQRSIAATLASMHAIAKNPIPHSAIGNVSAAPGTDSTFHPAQ